MANRDYYNVLDVPREAGPEQIKRAYRSLAMRFHPDRNPDDPIAEQRFKDVTQAYKVLSDSQERIRYERLGPLYDPNGRPPSPADVTGVVGRMWSNLFGRKPRADGEDLRHTIAVTLEEVATGTERDCEVPRLLRCAPCHGHGAPEAGRQTCSACEGTGRSRGARLLRTTCYHCDGLGYEILTPCSVCRGEGRVPEVASLRMHVPSGVASGQKLKLAGRGNEPARPGKTGDLFVIVDVIEHELFRRRGADIIAELPLTFAEATLGGEVPVPLLDGSTSIRVPPGTMHGRIFRLAGRGLPHVGRRDRGDLHLEVSLEIPANLTDAERTRLSAWAASLPEARHPRRAAFTRAIQERR